MASPGQPAPSPDPGRDADILRERDRIAGELQNDVIQQIFTIGLHLQSTRAIAVDPLVRRRVGQAIDDLDHVIQTIRDAVFDLEIHLAGPGLRAGIVHLSEQLSPVPDVSFRGPVDDALRPTVGAELLDILGDALAVIRARWSPVSIRVTAADGACVTTLRAVPLAQATAAGEDDDEFRGLRTRAARAGMRVVIEPGRDLVQISWQ